MNSNSDLMNHVDDAIDNGGQAARAAMRTGSSEVRNLIADVEDLIKRVAKVDDADIARARAKLEHTLAATRSSLHNGSERVRTTARQAATTTDHYVHENPWSAVGIAAAAGAAIAVLLSARLR